MIKHVDSTHSFQEEAFAVIRTLRQHNLYPKMQKRDRAALFFSEKDS